MIQLMLHHAMKLLVDVVVLARNLLAEAGVRQGGDGGDQLVMDAPDMLERFAPGRFAGVGDGREILLIGESQGLAAQTAADRAVPGGNVQDEFPYAVGLL